MPVIDACLTAIGLNQLGAAWEIWASEPQSAARRVARARLHLLFLLIRFGGLRLGEAFCFEAGNDLDRQTGRLLVSGQYARAIILPMPPMRLLRRILSLHEAETPGFAQLDAGFCRRTFYDVAARAGIHPALAGPRALRQARAHELLRLHVSPGNIREYLGVPGASR